MSHDGLSIREHYIAGYVEAEARHLNMSERSQERAMPQVMSGIGPNGTPVELAVDATGKLQVSSSGGSSAVAIADGADVALGAKADAAAASPAATASAISILKGLWTTLLSVVSTTLGMFKVYSPTGFTVLTGTFTRPADTTAYAAYDLVANSTSAATPINIASAVREASESVRIERVRLRKSNASLTNASFRIHFFRTQPTLSVNDNGVFNATDAGVLAVADIVGYVGYVDITMNRAGTAGAMGSGTPSDGSMTLLPSSGTTIYAVVEARAAYTPASGETFDLAIEAARS